MQDFDVIRLKTLLKQAVELIMPDLRKYYRVVRKAQVVATYASDGRYVADVQPLRNDESVDERASVVKGVEIPVLWAGKDRGVVCPPVVGAYCDLSYYDGDPNYPRISNFRWHGHGAPACGVEGFIIQLEPGVSVEIDPAKNIVNLTSANHETEAGGMWTVKAGAKARVEAPAIEFTGDELHTGNCTIKGQLTVDGNITATGAIMDAGGNSNHHSHP